MPTQIKEYKNNLGWIYQNVNNIICVFSKDRQFIKTISNQEFQSLIKIGMVK